jgi:hypothetical protein
LGLTCSKVKWPIFFHLTREYTERFIARWPTINEYKSHSNISVKSKLLVLGGRGDDLVTYVEVGFYPPEKTGRNDYFSHSRMLQPDRNAVVSEVARTGQADTLT